MDTKKSYLIEAARVRGSSATTVAGARRYLHKTMRVVADRTPLHKRGYRPTSWERGRPRPPKKNRRSDLLRICEEQINARRVSTPTGWDTMAASVEDHDRAKKLWLVHGSYWYEYSRRVGSYRQRGSYLCGRDDGQFFAVRVPGTILTVLDALDWLKPAAVKKAEDTGRAVIRQGDIWFVELRGGRDNVAALAHTAHEIVEAQDAKLACHPQHPAIDLTGKKWRAYQQTGLAANGGGD